MRGPESLNLRCRPTASLTAPRRMVPTLGPSRGPESRNQMCERVAATSIEAHSHVGQSASKHAICRIVRLHAERPPYWRGVCWPALRSLGPVRECDPRMDQCQSTRPRAVIAHCQAAHAQEPSIRSSFLSTCIVIVLTLLDQRPTAVVFRINAFPINADPSQASSSLWCVRHSGAPAGNWASWP